MTPQSKPLVSKEIIKQLGILAVIILIILVVVIHGSGAKKPAPVTAASAVPSINTQFDTNVLPLVNQRDSTAPDVSPQPGELGKSNPFSN